MTAAALRLAHIISDLKITRQECGESRFTSDQVLYQKRQEIMLRAKALGFDLVAVQIEA